MSRVFTVQRTLYGFKQKSDVMIPKTVIVISPSTNCTYIVSKEENMFTIAYQICSHIKAIRIIHDVCWMVDCGTSKETAIKCRRVVEPKFTDVYTLLAMIAGVLALCGLEEIGGGDVNKQNNTYSAIYTELAQSYKNIVELRELITDTLHRLSTEVE